MLKKILVSCVVLLLCLAIPIAVSAATTDPVRVYYYSNRAQSLNVDAQIVTSSEIDTYYSLPVIPDTFTASQYLKVAWLPDQTGMRIQIRFDDALSYYGTTFKFSMVVPLTTWENPYISATGSNVSFKRANSPLWISEDGGTKFFEYTVEGDIAGVENFNIIVDMQASAGIRQYQGFIVPISALEVSYTEDFIYSGYLAGLNDGLTEANKNVAGIFNALTALPPELKDHLGNLQTNVNFDDLNDAVTEINNNFESDYYQDYIFDFFEEWDRGGLPNLYIGFWHNMTDDWFFTSMFALFGSFALFSRVVFG